MISQVRLTNFKAFRDQAIDLGNLTVLTGANSSGKSTVLQALGLLRQTFLGASSSPGLALNGEWVQLGTGRDARHENWIATESNQGDIGIEVTEDERSFRVSARYVADSDVLPMREGAMADSVVVGPKFQYVQADRMVPQTSYPRSYLAVAQRNSIGAHGQYTADFLLTNQENFEVETQVRHPQEDRRSLMSQVEAWLGSISPGTNLDLAALEGTDSVRLSFRLGRSGLESSNSYRPTNVGFGLSYSLPIIVAALVSRPGGLLLVENPEAHLHPSGQAALGRLLVAASNSGTQVVLETHSDHVLNAIRLGVRNGVLPEERVRLQYFTRPERGEPEIDSPRVERDGSIDRWPNGFFDEWDSAIIGLTS